MQRALPRLSIWLITLFALYACASNVPHTPVEEKPATSPSAASKEIEKPAPPPVEAEKPATAAIPGVAAVPAGPAIEPPAAIAPIEVKPAPPVLPTEKPFPHIALLLPLQSPVFGSAAEAVQQGFMAAIDPKRLLMPVRVYSNFDENSGVVAVYRQAIANGARAIVGPLTRSGVSALAAEKDIPVPTLALNIVEGQPAKQLYFFGMSVEAEARQAAQLAKQQGLHQAIIVTTRSQLSQRMQAAFEEEWNGQANGITKDINRGILREIEFNDDPAVFADIADIADTVAFLATDAVKARLIRPYLPNKLTIYATSQIFSGNDNTLTNYDLNGIRFVDMPWLLQPDHPAVMVYPRATPPLSTDRERLYALGIDSFRLIQLLLTGKVVSALPLDGVSGQIQLSGQTFQRTPIQAVFVQGRAQLPDGPAAPALQIFPDKTISTP
jgi:outer membrane PBP1 activator LpoA protein